MCPDIRSERDKTQRQDYSMITALIWSRTSKRGRALDTGKVAKALASRFSPLFASAPVTVVREGEAFGMVAQYLPVQGWKGNSFEEEGRSWALAASYPVNATAALARLGTTTSNRSVLLALGSALSREPMRLLRELAPPFSLIWSCEDADEITVQNDGLGMSQLFEYECDDFWAITNRVVALQALCIAVEPVAEEWATRFLAGYFPLSITGYKRLRYLEPGTRIQISKNGIRRERLDVLGDWLTPRRWRPEECLEVARLSLLEYLRAALPLLHKVTAGLTGGRDSRAVVSSLRALGVEVHARVKGRLDSQEVEVAVELARIASIPLKIKTSAGIPSCDLADWVRNISLALLFQAGYMSVAKHKTFLSGSGRLESGQVNIMGQHGEIGRAFLYPEAEDHGHGRMDRLESIVARGFRVMPFMKRGLRRGAREVVRQAVQDTWLWGDSDARRADIFYLCQEVRRADAVVHSGKNFVIAPFLSPDFIRAVFSYGGRQRYECQFHDYIVAVNSPDWKDIPYVSGNDTRREVRGLRAATDRYEYILLSRTARYYNSLSVWREIGAPLIVEGIRKEGFWSEVFDKNTVHSRWI